MTTTEAKWAERVQMWRASGESAEAFSAGKGFEGSTLRFWASRLKVGATRRANKVAMVQLVRTDHDRDAASAIVVEVGRARILVRNGFEPRLLREVVRALVEPG